MRDENAGKRFSGDADERIVLVVAHKDVVARAEFFDEFGFADERFDLGGGFLERDVRGLAEHCLYFRRKIFLFPEIRNQPLADVGGFADVERRLAAAENIDAGVCGDVFRMFHHTR